MNPKKTARELSRDPYRGTRDFYPEDMFVQQYLFATMRNVAERYGYAEYGASILEETDLYRAKTGSEIVNEQIYSFTDRGGRDVTIRPEMTPTVARMVARKRRELSFPLRWYSIPNLLRYERPQRGRLREHWQLNVDVFGIEHVEADAEIIAVAADIMKAFGITEERFVIRLNNRKLLRAIMADYLGADEVRGYALSKLIDRREKMEASEFATAAEELIGARARLLDAVLDAKTTDDLPRELAANEGVAELERLMQALRERGIVNAVFDPSLVRGFDYYTGTVFEVFDANPANRRSLFGGGRYDDLVGIFGGEKVPGVGFGMGDVTIRDVLETYGLLPAYRSPVAVYLCTVSAEAYPCADALAAFLRGSGVAVAVDYTGRKIAAQIKSAEKQNIPFAICIGEEEERTKVFRLKNLATREERVLGSADLPAALGARPS